MKPGQMGTKPTKLVISSTTQAQWTTIMVYIMLYIQSHLLTIFPSHHVHIQAYILQALIARDSTLYLIGMREYQFLAK